jgi:hypothetical protein
MKKNINKPNFKLVKIDETSFWEDEELKSKAKKLYGIYLYNENLQVNVCDPRPCYEMHFIETVAETIPEEDVERNDFLEEIEQADANTDEVSYKYCSDIDSLDKNCNVSYSDYEPSKEEYETEDEYYNLVQDLICEYKGNPTF